MRLTDNQWLVLGFLTDGRSIGKGRLAQITGISRVGLSGVLKGLDGKGLTERAGMAPHVPHQGIHLWHLTDKGRAVMGKSALEEAEGQGRR